MKKILAISGSTRKQSSNLTIIKKIQELTADNWEMTICDYPEQLPHYNPDLDTEVAPKLVNTFRKAVSESDGVLICTPEYAMGIPGTLKNALDWTVSTGSFSQKAVSVITASSLGEKAHESLIGTIRIIDAKLPDETTLLISNIRTKFDADGELVDVETLGKIQELINYFEKMVQ
ncbi:MAG: NAD(P)H-dependent oxidoreductase [Flectobacillus sp.]|nr:NAD(P)H-dependent oxidoreductase [Flectobacillus sp.]